MEARRSLAAALVETGAVILYVLAAADIARAVILLAAAAGLLHVAAALLPGLLGQWAPTLTAALGLLMLAASVYAVVIARSSSRLSRSVSEGSLAEEEGERLLRQIALDAALAVIGEAWLTLLGLALVALGLSLYEAGVR